MNVVSFRRLVAVVVVAVGFAGCGSGGNPANNNGGGTPPGQQSCGGESVRIGNLTWMTKNLNVPTADSWCYDDASNCAKYGRLYTWDAARTACPTDWRLPTNEDWDALESVVGNNAGTKLKAKSPDWDGTDNYCFSALPGGLCLTDDDSRDVGSRGYWWTVTEYGSDDAYIRLMDSYESYVFDIWFNKSVGFSVRCVRD